MKQFSGSDRIFRFAIAILSSLLLSLPPLLVRATEVALTEILAVRFLLQSLVAIIALTAAYRISSSMHSTSAQLTKSILSGIVFSAYLYLFFCAIQNTNVDTAILISSCSCLIFFAIRETFCSTIHRPLMPILGVVVIIVSLAVNLSGDVSNTYVGEFQALVASILFSLYLYCSSSALRNRSKSELSSHFVIVSLVGFFVFNVAACINGNLGYSIFSPQLAIGMYMGICAGIGHLGLCYLMINSDTFTAAAASAISPVISVFLAIAIFRTEGIAVALLSIPLAILGVWLINDRQNNVFAKKLD